MVDRGEARDYLRLSKLGVRYTWILELSGGGVNAGGLAGGCGLCRDLY